jgi:hypothetical protein
LAPGKRIEGLSMHEWLRELLQFPLQLWFMIIGIPMVSIFIMVLAQSLVPGLIILGIALYPMYRILKRNADAQAHAGDSKKFLSQQEQDEAVYYMLKAKEKRERDEN